MNIHNLPHKRWTLRELINELEKISDKGKKDNLPVIINNSAEDYLYDLDLVTVGTYISNKDKEYPFISLNCYDNINPIDLSKDIED